MKQLRPSTEITPKHGAVLITGDAWTLELDIKAFYELDVSHKTFCINRSIMNPFVRSFEHWGVADADESVWFSDQIHKQFPEVIRHTLKDAALDQHFDCSWSPDGKDVTVWFGGSAMMAVEICDAMGYDSIILAGCPIVDGGHWYDARHYVQWAPETLEIWKAYKSDKLKSMSGYTRNLFGAPDGCRQLI